MMQQILNAAKLGSMKSLKFDVEEGAKPKRPDT
jgi:hypothetical protein